MTDTPIKDLLIPLRQYVVVALILGLGIIVSTILFFITRALEEHRTREHFELIASQQIDAVNTMITAHREFVYSIRSFYDGSIKVDRLEFRAFVNSALARHPSIRAAAWIPRVPASQRKAYEESARVDGYINFQITEQNLHGTLVRAAQRNEYYPFYYIEPAVDNNRIIGFDLASDPYLMTQLLRALDSPIVVATKATQSMQFPGKDSGALVALPIFAKQKPTKTLKERKTNLTGFVLALYDLGHLIKEALADLPGQLNELLITEVTDSLEEIALYHYTTDGQPVANSNATAQFKDKTRLYFRAPVEIANHKWNLHIIAGPGSFTRTGLGAEWATLTVGLLFTGLLALYFLRKKERIQTLAAAQTLAEHRMQEAEQARTEAERSERKFRNLLESAPDAIVMANEESKIILGNKQTERLFGYTQQELLSLPVEALIPERLRTKYVKHRADYAANPQVRAMGSSSDLWALKKDGTEFPIEISLSPIEGHEGVTVLATVRDITERKRTDKAMALRAQQLHRSNAELQQFAYVISHDLQEPLRMVSSYVQLLAKRYKDSLDSDANEFIAYAVDGADRMKRLITNLLTYARITTRGKALKPISCEEVVELALTNLKVALEESNAMVTHDPLPVVTANKTQLLQLFQNLIGNAIKFRGEHSPKIHISARKNGEFQVSSSTSQVAKDDGLEISTQQSAIQNPKTDVRNPKSAIQNPKSYEWVFSVRDNGIGIAWEAKERIFTVFQRLHDNKKYPGTGIGLAICKKIIERHGGRIWVESVPGKGATFYFILASDREHQ